MSAQHCNDALLSLRERQTAGTRAEIIEVAMALLSQNADVSHELIARQAGMSARTVYRHFPDRAALMIAVWQRLREVIEFKTPATDQEIVSVTRTTFRALNTHEALVKGVIASAASARIWNLPGNAAREAFTASLTPILTGMPEASRKFVIGCFVAIFSAPFWNLLRSRAELSAEETEEAAAWMLTVLLDSLRANRTTEEEKGHEQGHGSGI